MPIHQVPQAAIDRVNELMQTATPQGAYLMGMMSAEALSAGKELPLALFEEFARTTLPIQLAIQAISQRAES